MPDDDFLYQFQEPLPEDFNDTLHARLKQIEGNTNHREPTNSLHKTMPTYRAKGRRATLTLGLLTVAVAAVTLVFVLYFIDFNSSQEGVLDVTASLDTGLSAPLRLGDGSIDWLAWSPDGSMLAAAGSRKVFVYDDTLKLLTSWDIGARASALAFGDDALAVGAYDGTVHLWNPAGIEIASFQAHTSSVNALAFAPGGAWLATASDDFTVAIWSAESGAEIDRVGTRGGTRLNALAISPSGDLLVAGDENGVVWVWQIDAEGHFGELTVPITSSKTGIYMALAFNATGDRLAVGANNELMIFDTTDWQSSPRLWKNSPHLMALDYTSDATLFVALGNAYSPGVEQLYMVDSPAGDIQIPPPDGNYTQVALSPDATRLAAIEGDHTLVIWKLNETDYTLEEIARHRAGTGFFFDVDIANGRVAACTQRELWLFDAATGEVLQTWTLTTPPPWFYAVDFSPDGETLIAQTFASPDYAQVGYEYFVIDLTAILETASWTRQTADIPLNDIAFQPHGALLATGGETIRFWEIGETGLVESPTSLAEAIGESLRALHGSADARGDIARLAFSSDGAMLAAWSTSEDGGHLYVWDSTTGQQISEISSPGRRAGLFAGFTPDGAYILTTSTDDNPAVSFWEIETGKFAFALSHDAPIFHAAFSLDGAHLAAAAADGVWLWDEQDLDAPPQRMLDAHATRVHFDGTGRYLLARLLDGSMVVWR